METKICRQCGAKKSATREYFRVHCKETNELVGVCRDCSVLNGIKYRERCAQCAKTTAEESYAAYREKLDSRLDQSNFNQLITQQKLSAKKHGTLVTLTFDQWTNCKSHFNNQCAYCGKPTQLYMEHVHPIVKGGNLSVDNVVPACHICNSSKNHRNFITWYRKQPYYDLVKEIKVITYLQAHKSGNTWLIGEDAPLPERRKYRKENK